MMQMRKRGDRNPLIGIGFIVLMCVAALLGVCSQAPAPKPLEPTPTEIVLPTATVVIEPPTITPTVIVVSDVVPKPTRTPTLVVTIATATIVVPPTDVPTVIVIVPTLEPTATMALPPVLPRAGGEQP